MKESHHTHVASSASQMEGGVDVYDILYYVSIVVNAIFESTSIADGIKNMRKGSPNGESTTLLGIGFLAMSMYSSGLVRQGTLRERIMMLTMLVLGSLALVLNLLSFVASPKQEQHRSHALLYTACVLVLMVASVLSWLVGKAMLTTEEKKEEQKKPKKKEGEDKKPSAGIDKLPLTYIVGLVLNVLMYGSSIWGGVRNIRDGAPNGQLLLLTSLLFAARLLRCPKVLSKGGTVRETLLMVTLIPLTCATIVLNLIPYRSKVAYASCVAVAILGAVLTVLFGRKLASFFVSEGDAKRKA